MEVIYLTQKQLAARWRRSEACLGRWRCDGIGPKFRPRLWSYRESYGNRPRKAAIFSNRRRQEKNPKWLIRLGVFDTERCSAKVQMVGRGHSNSPMKISHRLAKLLRKLLHRS